MISADEQTGKFCIGSAESFLESVKTVERIILVRLSRHPPEIIENTIPFQAFSDHLPLQKVIGHHIAVAV